MNLKYLNAINIVFGPHRVKGLLKRFKSPEKVWDSGYSKLANINIEKNQLDVFVERRKNLNIEKAWQRLKEHKVNLLSLESEEYPALLKEIPSPPVGLYIKGNRSLLNQPSIAIVGTRRASGYGKMILPRIIEDLLSSGLVIVSGLAQGIDAEAHKLTLEKEGKTIAVMGRGLDDIFPRINSKLADNILQKEGLFVSEYPMGTPPLKQHFPARNRIIAGLSSGVFVVESQESGGALITARQALEYNREVFALPGPINLPNSRGTNKLIQQGAKLVSESNDILEELSAPLHKDKIKDTLEKLTLEEKMIINTIEREPLHIDEVIRRSKLNPSQVRSVLTSLELKNVIKNTGGDVWQSLKH